jgi:hypothetical protein
MLVGGLAAGLAVWLTAWLTAWYTAVGVAMGPAGLPAGLKSELAVWLGAAFTATPVAGITAVLVLNMTKTAWPWYMLARGWLALRRQLPWSFMSFLDDAHKRGVLRQVGTVYQFRHIELQHRLATPSKQQVIS